MQDHIKYNIEGEVQLDIKYKPIDAFDYNFQGSFGAVILLIFVIVLIAVLVLSFGEFPSGLSIMAVVFSLFAMMANVFSKRHYLLTEKGIGFIFVNIRPVTMFVGWEHFKGFSVSKDYFRLYAKNSSSLPGMVFPKKIPAKGYLEDARFILQQYLPEF